MALDFSAILNVVVSHAKSLGVFEVVTTHEPKSAPNNGVCASVWLESVVPVRTSGLAATSMRVELSVRIYKQMLAEPEDDIDLSLTDAMSLFLDTLSDDFELGGQVRSVDLLGSAGTPLSARAGYVRQDSGIYRVITVTVPLIVNDVHTQAA